MSKDVLTCATFGFILFDELLKFTGKLTFDLNTQHENLIFHRKATSKNCVQLFCTPQSSGHSLMNNFNLSSGHSWGYATSFLHRFQLQQNHLLRYSFFIWVCFHPRYFYSSRPWASITFRLSSLWNLPLLRSSDTFPPNNKVLRLLLIALIPRTSGNQNSIYCLWLLCNGFTQYLRR